MKYFAIIILLLAGCHSDHANHNHDDHSHETHQESGEGSDMKEDVKKVLNSKEGVQILHQNFSAHTFNECWKYIEMKNRSEEDIENMLILANASLWHWKKRTDCTPENLSIAYWQLGRVNALAKDADLCKKYGAKCLKVSTEGKLSPFCMGYAYEVLTDAAILAGDKQAAESNLAKVIENLAKIKDDYNKKLLQGDADRLAKQIDKM